jgi:hypothetical protein
MKNRLTGVTTPFSNSGVTTPMKQIIINADDETHAWLAEQAKAECRTIGNQALFLLGLNRPASKPSKTKKGARK